MMELFYIKLGSTPLIDSLFIYLNTNLAILSTLLNLCSFLVFRHIRLNKKEFHQYLKCYTLVCAFICFISIFNNIFTAPRFINLNTILISFYKCKISLWFTTTIHYYLNMLDCVLLLERISCFTTLTFIKRFFKIKPYFVCFILFIFCNLINLAIHILQMNQETIKIMKMQFKI
jgi:hypothetical protein